MLIATFNVNSIRSRLPAVLAWLEARRPDVLCLQETKVQDAQFPEAALSHAGYHALFRGEKAYNGVALLSRVPPDDARFGLDDGEPADETRLVAARCGPIHVVNTYVPQGRALDHPLYPYKLRWFERLRLWFGRHFTPRTPLVWAGDLNVAPNALDIHNAEQQAQHVCYHASVRAAFERTRAWGFTDVFRQHHPEGGHYTFFDYRTANAVQRNLGWRVDHILATAPLAAVCRSCEIDRGPRLAPKASDHTVLAADFDAAALRAAPAGRADPGAARANAGRPGPGTARRPGPRRPCRPA